MNAIKPGTLIRVIKDLEYDPPFYLYPVANGSLKMPAGTMLNVIKTRARTWRSGGGIPQVWVRFSDQKLLVPTDACKVITETSDESRKRICEELLSKAQLDVTTNEVALKEARERLSQATKIAEVLSQLRPGDLARISLYAYDMVARIEKFERAYIKVSVLASEVNIASTVQLTALFGTNEIYRLEKFPATDLPLLLGWKYQTPTLEKIIKGRKT